MFLAECDREAAVVERLLDEQGIDYDVRQEMITHETSGPCYQGLLFEVAASHAGRVRELLENAGVWRRPPSAVE